MTRGHNYLGGFIGSAETKDLWVGDKISVWTAAVETLSKIALKWPQTAYTGFTFVLQNEWQYVQRVVAGIGFLFAPLERMIRDHFLPSLLGIPACEIDGEYRTLLSHSVKTGGMAVRNPLETAEFVHDTSKTMTRHLVASLVERNTPFDPSEHRSTVAQASTGARRDRLARERMLHSAALIDRKSSTM